MNCMTKSVGSIVGHQDLAKFFQKTNNVFWQGNGIVICFPKQHGYKSDHFSSILLDSFQFPLRLMKGGIVYSPSKFELVSKIMNNVFEVTFSLDLES